jgi:hypothetical protein
MKIVFIVYHDILEDRISLVQEQLGIDFFTKWENVTGKGHTTDAHLGTRTFPGYNTVKMVAFTDEYQLDEFIEEIGKLNNEMLRADDKVRVFQLPLERIL